MMNKLLMGALAASGLALLPACSDTFDPSSDSEGRILLDIDLNRDVAAPKAAEKSRAAGQATEITATDLKLTLKADDGSMERSWASLTDFDNAENFPVGMYTMEASYGDIAGEGFEQPYYFGSTSLRVKENETTPVSITARLGNAMVSVVYTDAVRQYFTACKGEVVSSTGTAHAYPLDETRALYVKPGHVEINAEFTKPNGISGRLNCASFEAEARHHYIVTVDANSGEVGKGELIITFNSDLVEEEVTLDISDDVLTAPAPTISVAGFTPGEALTVVEGTNAATPLRMTVMAQGVVNTAVLTTNSVSLREQGWPETVDFAAADAATLGKLKELGLSFPGLEGVKSKMALVDFTNVLSHIEYVDGGNNTIDFTLTAKDAYSKVSEPVTLTVNIEKLQLSVENIQPLAVEETELTFDVLYNGGDLKNDVKFEVRNARGSWDEVGAVSIAPVSRAAATYCVTIAVPNSAEDVTFRASCGRIATEEQVVVRKGAAIELSEGDVFATHAALTVKGSNGATLAPQAKLLLSTNGADFTEHTDKTVDGAGIAFTGLNPGTKYYVKLDVNDGESKVLEFTTEAAAQLPNPGFDEWTPSQKGDYQYLWTIADGSAWATLNELTISTSGSGSGNGLNTGGCAYKATSGTIPANSRSTKTTDDGGTIGTKKSADGNTVGNATLHSDKQHSGANAALIRSVGWGSGNTASGKTSGQLFGTCQNLTPGQLYLGSYKDGELEYGYSFTSRPSSMSFYYHYDVVSAGNGDYGTAEISVMDADGNVIATADVQKLTEQSAYTLVTMELNYTDLQTKAAKISVIFKSSANADAMSKSTTFWRCPGVKNVSGGEYVGSELYIDDIVLNY